MDTELPDKLFFKIGEVAKVTGVKPYVLRYWESEFRLVRPQKSRSGQRLYQRKDIELLLRIKRLLYDEKYTISGAKKRLRMLREERQLALDFGGEHAPAPVAPDPQDRPEPRGPEPRLRADVLRRIQAELEGIFELVREDESVP